MKKTKTEHNTRKERERERERERETDRQRERERETVCVCVQGARHDQLGLGGRSMRVFCRQRFVKGCSHQWFQGGGGAKTGGVN